MTGTQSVALWILLIIGIGLCGYGGYLWATHDGLSEGERQLAEELAYQADVAKTREQLDEDFEPSAEWEKNRRAAIREDIAEATGERGERGRSWLIAGIALLIFSLGRMFARSFGSRDRSDQ